jgi:nicotinamidase-related amidase
MHRVGVRQEIIDRVLARRGRYHWFEELDPRRTVLLIIDMQELFCAPGAPAEVPGSRDIVEPINRLTEQLRAIGVPIIWVLHANTETGERSDWELFLQLCRRRRGKRKDPEKPGARQSTSLVGSDCRFQRHSDHQESL